MSTTIEYLDYRRDLTKDALHPVAHGSGEESPVGFAGLSAFNIPREIRFQVTPSGAVHMQFCYSDEEPGEKRSYTLPTASGVELILGKETKKIIEIRVQNPAEFFLHPKGELNKGALQLSSKFPPRNQRILAMSSQVITDILANLPQQLRKQLLKQVSGYRSR